MYLLSIQNQQQLRLVSCAHVVGKQILRDVRAGIFPYHHKKSHSVIVNAPIITGVRKVEEKGPSLPFFLPCLPEIFVRKQTEAICILDNIFG